MQLLALTSPTATVVRYSTACVVKPSVMLFALPVGHEWRSTDATSSSNAVCQDITACNGTEWLVQAATGMVC